MWHFLQDVYFSFVEGLKQTSATEFIAVLFGVVSVLFSRRENILVYPTGLVNTTLFIYLSVQAGLYAEASVNAYYTVMSIVGWVNWSKKADGHPALRISRSNAREWMGALLFFSTFWAVLSFILARWTDSTVPVADGFASATAYTGMWLMTRKKLENWLWWIVTNAAAIPLYFTKGLVFTSFQYLVFLALAIAGFLSWSRRLRRQSAAEV
jgi:nicotinamide mononucleotide transporter PnuC